MHSADHRRRRLAGLALAMAVAVAATACASSHPGNSDKAATAPRTTAAPASPTAASRPAVAITPTPAASPAVVPAVKVSPAANAATTSLAAAYSSNLVSVSCSHGSWCMAVGSWSASQQSPSRTLAGAWNGTSWQILATPDPAGTAASSLTSVSCTSAGLAILLSAHAREVRGRHPGQHGGASPPGGKVNRVVPRVSPAGPGTAPSGVCGAKARPWAVSRRRCAAVVTDIWRTDPGPSKRFTEPLVSGLRWSSGSVTGLQARADNWWSPGVTHALPAGAAAASTASSTFTAMIST